MELHTVCDEDARKLRLASDVDGPCYLQHTDGTWSMVGPDGWPVSLDEYAELHADSRSAIAATSIDVVDIEPISVRDSEI
ncbi:hypothetical protein [Nocardia sp. CC227C]|uniref:hypothetical protein n=1 Tax=Nocardia sp. CC227C TaxID=3044562 RepID=UPI00278C28EA|nr:hypothetical protein [Nocardia sp. CC227C]